MTNYVEFQISFTAESELDNAVSQFTIFSQINVENTPEAIRYLLMQACRDELKIAHQSFNWPRITDLSADLNGRYIDIKFYSDCIKCKLRGE
tara:strand:- start:141 stop:416 length:276 start_codon:yes stop_codon:yes gene_type:complete